MLVRALKGRYEAPWFLSQIVCGLSRCVETFFREQEFPTDPLKSLSAAPLRLDRVVRQTLIELPQSEARNAYRASAFLKRCGLSISHRSWADKHFLRRFHDGPNSSLPPTAVWGGQFFNSPF